MTKAIILGMTLSISFVALAATAYAQGAAEYSILSGSASSATVKAGSALNQATKGLAGRLGENLTKSTQRVAPNARQKPDLKSTTRVRVVRTPSALTQSTGSLQGMQVICGPGDVKTTGATSNAASSHGGCISAAKETSPNGAADLTAKAQAQQEYPSSINLSFPK
jgi:hypothetical protein